MTIHPTPKMRYSSSCYSLSLAYNESSASHFFLTQRHQGWSLPGPQSLFRGPTLGESGAWWAVRRCPKFTFSTFTPDPNLHKSQIYTGPKFTQIPDLHETRIYTNPDLHGTQIYTNPYLHSPDLHKSISAPRLQKTQIYTTQIYTKPEFTQNFFFKFCSN